MSDTTAVYAEIVKFTENEDGTVNAFGRATSDDLDLDKQICDPTWLSEAMPAWFETGANVREQHGQLAAGVGRELTQNGAGWDLKSHVVDPTSALKVKHGVLKGYSIGIRNPRVVKDAKAPGGRIVGGQIVEVSLVDRPANPTCTLTLAKSIKPGPVIAQAVDTERGLVKVEELHEAAAAVAPEGLDELHEALKALDLVAVVKGDQARDIRDAEQAIAIIAGLIQSEAAQLAGDTDYEACDIALLLDAVRALDYFKCRERKEPAMAHVDLSAEADVEKSAAPDAAPAAEKAAPVEAPAAETPEPVVEKAAAPAGDGDEDAGKHDLTELVKALGVEVGSLKEQLTKALSAPAPGGPVLTRTAQDATKSDARDAHLAKAAQYDRAAEEVRDPQARAGYLQLAAQERGLAATS